MIDVSCAIIVKDAKILAVQRGSESSHPWKWEFPGGKIHWDETAKQSVIREIHEELSVEIDVLVQLESVEFDYGDVQIRLIPFVCRVVSGEIILNEHVNQRWFRFDDWKLFDWSGADFELIRRNRKNLKKILKENL